ncbi:MAG TPA: hypothetical protein VGB85_32860 [Nannocystis sp.]|jgi:hypothetical protein
MKTAPPGLVRRPREILATLNSEAGDHAVVTDPRELQAAIRAGERSWQRFPYYEQRYAERGEKFTRSDSAWLASLADYGQSTATSQIIWLGRVLASRGMPRWLLELHLGVLHDELSRALPARASIYATLLGAADTLRALREEHIPAALFTGLTTSFAEQVGPEWDSRLPETGGLLAAAVADEKAGIALAVPSLAIWMTDASRFPPRWISAVEATIERARDHSP